MHFARYAGRMRGQLSTVTRFRPVVGAFDLRVYQRVRDVKLHAFDTATSKLRAIGNTIREVANRKLVASLPAPFNAVLPSRARYETYTYPSVVLSH